MMSAYATVPPGDRYLTQNPCGPQCCGSSGSFSDESTWIAVKPYSFVFRAPVKGRWLGRGLLDLFLHEFAFLPYAPGGDTDQNTESGCSGSVEETVDSLTGGKVGAARLPPPASFTRSAVVPLLLHAPSTTNHGDAETAGGGGGATLDRRFTLPAYVEELCDGVLWLHGREAECRAVGRRYRNALIEIAHTRGAQHKGVSDGESKKWIGIDSGGVSNVAHCDASSSLARASVDGGDANGREETWQAWCRTVLWLSQLPSEEEVDSILPLLNSLYSSSADGAAKKNFTSSASSKAPLPPPLVLRQRDTVYHRVWRREGRIFAQPPLKIIRCDLTNALTRSHASTASSASFSTTANASKQAPALIAVSKPPGMPVHPSGCYRKNSVTSILEDVFGGCDSGRRYMVEEHFTEDAHHAEGKEVPFRPYVSILHRIEKFELIRVYVRLPSLSSGPASSSCTEGVSLEDWGLLRELLLRRANDQESGDGVKGSSEHAPTLGADATAAVPPSKRPRETEAPAEASPSAVKCATAQGDNSILTPAAGMAAVTTIDTSKASPIVFPPLNYALKAFVVHRLDAATSGVLLFGLDSASARRTAVAIANKAESSSCGATTSDPNRSKDNDDGEWNSDEEEVGFAMTADALTAGVFSSSSQKVYFARVYGRVDLPVLARTQHHCSLRQSTEANGPNPSSLSSSTLHSSHHNSSVADAAGVDVVGDELVVQRPIGCVDHHHSLYWCPDATLTDAWWRQKRELAQKEVEEEKGAAEAHSHTNVMGTLNEKHRKEKGNRTAEALAAKHEKMRRLTRGSAGCETLSLAQLTTSTSCEGEAVMSDGQQRSGAQEQQVLKRVQQYVRTLRSATTILRVDHYDALTDQTVIRCTLGTGRTHQLRVHVASLGHPIVRDSKYVAMETFLREIGHSLQKYKRTSLSIHEADQRAHPANAFACLAADTPLSLFYAAMATRVDQIQNTDGNPTSSSNDNNGAVQGIEVGKDSCVENTTAAPPAWKSAFFADSRTARGCVCPDAICLHAWRYTLTYKDSEEVVRVEVPLPSWARSE